MFNEEKIKTLKVKKIVKNNYKEDLNSQLLSKNQIGKTLNKEEMIWYQQDLETMKKFDEIEEINKANRMNKIYEEKRLRKQLIEEKNEQLNKIKIEEHNQDIN